MPLSTAGPGLQVRKGGKQLFVFDLNVLDDSTRKVYGLATDPQLDRENETILKKAIENALPNFMMLPIMHLDHTERPVGWFTKAEFRGQDLYVEACVKPTSDCDEFWRDVVKASRLGKPYQFSIYGDRVECTPSCALDPAARSEPCITKALALYSISICQPGSAINPNTFAEVMKAMNINRTNTQRPCRKATDSASGMIHPTTDGKYPKEVTKTMDPEDEKEKGSPEEGSQKPMKDVSDGPELENKEPEGGGDMKPVIELLTQVVQRLQSLESSLGLYKAETKPENEEDEKKPDDEEKETIKCSAKKAAVIESAKLESVTITKAELGRLQKAEAQIATLTAELTQIKKSTAKGPEMIVIDPSEIKKSATDDPTKEPNEKSLASAMISGFGKFR